MTSTNLLGSERIRNMAFLVACIILIFNSRIMRAKPFQPNNNNEAMQKYQSINTILTNYVESRFPHLNRQQQSQMKMFLVHKIKRDMIMKIMRGNLKMPWGGSDDTFARMLK